ADRRGGDVHLVGPRPRVHHQAVQAVHRNAHVNGDEVGAGKGVDRHRRLVGHVHAGEGVRRDAEVAYQVGVLHPVLHLEGLGRRGGVVNEATDHGVVQDGFDEGEVDGCAVQRDGAGVGVEAGVGVGLVVKGTLGEDEVVSTPGGDI